MRKFFVWFMIGILTIGAIGFAPTMTGAEDVDVADVTLTEEQKNEMEALQKQALDQKKEIINKYVEYGVFTEDKGKKIISHFEKHYNMLEKNGFVPKWDKKRKHCNDDEE
ncbi:YckD family protein [Evansella sp. AB-rgal1]|uniref:YckD family protein n=1 Tax=Evansella sp. AB-rgal1 TaxID=3242696 RepID=UPI00359E6F5D